MAQEQNFKTSLTVGFMNIRGQSKLNTEKQLQIEAFLKQYKCDILHLQETNIEHETFSSCSFISNNYNIIQNNCLSQYGTSSLVKSEFVVENVRCDSEGRALIFDVGEITFANLYFNSGTDAIARAGREKICSEVLPNLLINSKENGCAGGDLNCIIDKKDATKYPEAKMSKCLQRLVKVRNWKDSFRCLHPATLKFSRFYEKFQG
jgi:exonuclease III